MLDETRGKRRQEEGEGTKREGTRSRFNLVVVLMTARNAGQGGERETRVRMEKVWKRAKARGEESRQAGRQARAT